MVLLNVTRLIPLLGDSHMSMVLIMRRNSLVAKITSILTLIALVAARRWPLYQIDLKNVFLNCDL